jgi:hypothetical protein
MSKEPVFTSKRNLTRFTYETTAFQGWRLSISRKGTTFSRYFSDRRYGGGKKSLKAAEECLKKIKTHLGSADIYRGKLTVKSIEDGNKILDAA